MMDSLNVFGEPLQPCSHDPLTGFYRDGCCNTGPEDRGEHSVCAEMTDGFLLFSKSHGNNLSDPVPAFGFSGLKAGDRWCLCAPRWVEAYEAGVAPRLVLASTHQDMLRLVPIEVLKQYALDLA